MIKRDIQPAASGAMLLPRSVLEHLKDASADELRALIYICAFDGCYDDTDACETCGITESQLNSAVSFWRGTKVLRLGDSQGDHTAARFAFEDKNHAGVRRRAAR